MKGKLDETPFQTNIQRSYGGFEVHIRLKTVYNSYNLSFRFELSGHQWKSTPSRFDNSPPMECRYLPIPLFFIILIPNTFTRLICLKVIRHIYTL